MVRFSDERSRVMLNDTNVASYLANYFSVFTSIVYGDYHESTIIHLEYLTSV
jgi:hypothetical protein